MTNPDSLPTNQGPPHDPKARSLKKKSVEKKLSQMKFQGHEGKRRDNDQWIDR